MTATLVLETSAIIAILNREVGSDSLFDQIKNAQTIVCPTNCVVEAVIVLTRQKDIGPKAAQRDVFDLLEKIDAALVSFNEIAMHHALDGYARFGKGTGKSPAVLNFGDCLSYGAAKAAGGKLLFTGGDFGLTDLA
jgi:ribonuclease VapC